MKASAGTEDKMDAVVTVYDEISGNYQDTLEIAITSPVGSLFGKDQHASVREALKDLGVQRCKVEVVDKQAVDAVIRARVMAAVIRLRNAGGVL